MIFKGSKFEAVPKRVMGTTIGFTPSPLEENHEQVASFINRADQWASGYGYEYHSMTDTCFVFKRVGG